MPDGLAVMVEGYHLLGLDDLSEQTLTVLKANYPDYPYLDKEGNFKFQDDMENERRSWLNIATAGLLGYQGAIGFDSRKFYNKESLSYRGDDD